MHPYEVLRRPVLTEKSNYAADELHRYTFEVDVRATKQQVREAVQLAFNVKVVSVNVMNVRGKAHHSGRHTSYSSDWRKAVVTLASGDSISFFEGV